MIDLTYSKSEDSPPDYKKSKGFVYTYTETT